MARNGEQGSSSVTVHGFLSQPFFCFSFPGSASSFLSFTFLMIGEVYFFPIANQGICNLILVKMPLTFCAFIIGSWLTCHLLRQERSWEGHVGSCHISFLVSLVSKENQMVQKEKNEGKIFRKKSKVMGSASIYSTIFKTASIRTFAASPQNTRRERKKKANERYLSLSSISHLPRQSSDHLRRQHLDIESPC